MIFLASVGSHWYRLSTHNALFDRNVVGVKERERLCSLNNQARCAKRHQRKT